ncbi:13277_t:CDS:1, partial [Ambispora gerdemannii]
YYSANARYLLDEAIKDIKTSFSRVSDAINTMAKKYRISVSRAKEYIENQKRKQQMIDFYPSQVQSTISSEITSVSLDPKGHCFAINNQLEDNYIPLLQSRSLGDESEIRDSVSSLNYDSSSLHTSVKTSNQQIKKRRSKSKSIRVSDLSTISDTQVEEALNEGEKRIERSDHILNSHSVSITSNS